MTTADWRKNGFTQFCFSSLFFETSSFRPSRWLVYSRSVNVAHWPEANIATPWIEKLENIFPGVFLLEFITENFCVFELLLFWQFFFPLSFFRFILVASVFISITSLPSPLCVSSLCLHLAVSTSSLTADAITAKCVVLRSVVEGGRGRGRECVCVFPNGLVDSLKFYHCILNVRTGATKAHGAHRRWMASRTM